MRITPRVGGGVWAENEKEKGKRKKEKVKKTLLRAVLSRRRGGQSTLECSCFMLPFTFLLLPSLEIRTAREFQIRQTHPTHEHLIGTDRRGRGKTAAATGGDQ